MKKILSSICFVIACLLSYAQQNASLDELPSNSFETALKSMNPEITYAYLEESQTHDYSGNWDFDEDGIKDKVYFVGTGGAHLYYKLRIELSSDGVVRNFNYLLLDFPLLENEEKIIGENFETSPMFPQFVVSDFDADGNHEIYLGIDNSTDGIVSKKLKKKGVDSEYILINFKKKKNKNVLVFSDY